MIFIDSQAQLEVISKIRIDLSITVVASETKETYKSIYDIYKRKAYSDHLKTISSNNSRTSMYQFAQ